jgi:hypothetical protein
MIICDRRERAQLIWVSYSYSFLIACLTFLDSMFPFSKLSLLFIVRYTTSQRESIFIGGASELFFFLVDAKKGRNKMYKNYSPTMILK